MSKQEIKLPIPHQYVDPKSVFISSIATAAAETYVPSKINLTDEEHDIELVMSQTMCSEDVAAKTLKKWNGDIIEAIIEITTS